MTAQIATVLALLHEQVKARGDVPCLVVGEQKISYQQIWDEARRVEAWLHAQGVQDGDRIALLMENCPQYVAVFYGALLAGAVVVPMNTDAKMKDFSNWLGHCGARVAFVDFIPREMHKLPNAGLPVQLVAVNTASALPPELVSTGLITWDQLAAMPVPATDPVLDRPHDALACIIYTSGTTGNPKGVMISHGNLMANTRSILAALPIHAGDRFLNVLPFYYSYGNSVLHTHLARGATLYLENSLMFPNRIVARMAAEKITGFAGVPSSYALLLSRGKVAEHDLSSLRYVLQAGGAMPVPVIEQVLAQISEHVYVMYGQTEATARLTWLPPAKLKDKLGSVGIPIDGVEIQIRNPAGVVCAPGEEGELFVHGDNVAIGYWQNPQATAATFIGDWLKTGDLGYRDEEGFIFLKGRRSDMIKSGANRISPLEIEEVIVQLPDVEEVAVVGVPDDLLGQTIAAFLVIKSGCELDERAVKKHCLDNLASYKIPKQIVRVAALPKTLSGKVKKYILVEQVGKLL